MSRRFLRVTGNRHVVLSALAVVVGVLASLGEFVFFSTVEIIQWLAFGPGAIEEVAADLPALYLVLVPTLGGLLVGFLATFVLPGRLPQGVAEAMEASALRGGRMPFRVGMSAALLSILSIGCGASVGREGPVVHLGATLSATVARRLRLRSGDGRTLLGCGVAAAVAAAFNAPIAGVFFALEVVVGHYALATFSPVVVASVTGTVISRSLHGDITQVIVPPQEIVSNLEFPAFIMLGLLCGLAAILFLRAIALVQHLHDRLATPVYLRPAMAGLAVGIGALFVPQILGIGYATTLDTLNGVFTWETLLVIAAAKGLATALCLGSRFGGGIFSPSLVLGALIGVAFDGVAGTFFPALSSEGTLYGLLGMGAFAGATLGAPISTILMIFELTQDYAITFALMVCVSVASLLCRVVNRHSFFTWQLAQRGIELGVDPLERMLLRRRRVKDLRRSQAVSLAADATLRDVAELMAKTRLPVFVQGADNQLIGRIDPVDVAVWATGTATEYAPSCAGDLAEPVGVVLHQDDTLERAFAETADAPEDQVPVVDGETGVLLGVVTTRDLERAHYRALHEVRMIKRGED